jgi:hypothetical protein
MEEAMMILLWLLGISAICLYVTYLYYRRVRGGERGWRSFWQWLKHLAGAVWGI